MKSSSSVSLMVCVLSIILGTATPARSAFLVTGDKEGFKALLNNPDVSQGGAWDLTAAGRLFFKPTGATNTFVNQLLAYNKLDRTVNVGRNVPFVFFGGWGPPTLPAGTQIIDLDDFDALRGSVLFEPLLDIKASLLLHELAEVGEDGADFGRAHGVGIVDENLVLRMGGSTGQRLPPPDVFVPGLLLSQIKFPWQDTRAGVNGYEVFDVFGLAGGGIIPLRPQWVRRGGWASDTEFDPTGAPSDLQIKVQNYYFEAVPEPNVLGLVAAGLIALFVAGGLSRSRVARINGTPRR